ncbi:ParB/RepB/Spo0J family partition protein [Rubellimicrobium aerolatum]|uniref:ParB/RepB/Spo0J family partition protein n=1 Tax=Rubellimicrobium aerolatum TaxID=490979 RepID=A0ABW0SE21_9RHOB|nr:ParB/RepB/Spo0J family partition protein [Rubellimicrobium aerolatum]MBP1807002.1 ParB family chromosome partitioning protein [Rubellimicrobium aerolatum]
MITQSLVAEAAALVPFTDLYLSPLNPRGLVSEAGIEALAQNIRELGLIQNLAGLRDETGRVGVVAGGRRLRALALLQDDPRFQAVPVRLAPDEATAVVWASTENHHREQPHPADEVREYGAMAARGIAVPAIAIAFGVSDKHVQRRLALARLPAPVLQALRDDQISLGQAAAFTISDDEAVSLQVLARVRGQSFSDHQIKRLLKPESIRGTDRRAVFVGREAYLAAGGRLGGDLFTEEDLFDSPDVLDRMFEAKLRAEAEALRVAQGWAWAEISLSDYLGHPEIERWQGGRLYPAPGELTEEQAARYDELAELANGDVLDEEGEAELAALSEAADGAYTPEQKAHAGIILRVDHRGEVRVHDGIVRPEDCEAAIAAGVLAPSLHGAGTGPKPPKPAISAALAEDLTRITRGARQSAALDHPELLLDLLAFQLVGQLGYRYAFGLRPTEVRVQPLSETGYTLDERLQAPRDAPKDPWTADFAKAFRAFRKRGPEAVRADLVRSLAALLDVEDETLGALIDKEAKADLRKVWTPTAENFFARVGGSTLDALWCELLELAPEHPTATSFAKLKKREKAETLEALFADPRAHRSVTEAQATRIATWRPETLA